MQNEPSFEISPFLEWFHREGFPKGKLGMLLSTIYEIKINGLEKLPEPLKKKEAANFTCLAPPPARI
jgi:hypothetical protein